MLARFFAHAPSVPLRGEDYLARFRLLIAENAQALRAMRTGINQPRADAVIRAQRRFLKHARRSLEERAGRVVEGHGDLRAEHVCLAAPMCVIDCLEFKRTLRELDPFEEVAFLALEIERLGHRALADELIREFRTASGDSVNAAIVSFYKSHQAMTRARLAAWHVGDPQFPDARPWLARANSYLADAERHVRLALSRTAAADSAAVGRRPAFQERRKRNPGNHAPDRLPEKRTDVQHFHSAEV
jgi:aminoglycoside phosphotransferase family enzyme